MNVRQGFTNLGRGSIGVKQRRPISANVLRLYQQEICDLELQCQRAGNGIGMLQQSVDMKMAEAEAIMILIDRRKDLAGVLLTDNYQAAAVVKLNREVTDLGENYRELVVQIKCLQQRQNKLRLTLGKALQLAGRHRGDLKKLQKDAGQEQTARYSISVLELLEQVNQSCSQLTLLIPVEVTTDSADIGNKSSLTLLELQPMSCHRARNHRVN